MGMNQIDLINKNKGREGEERVANKISKFGYKVIHVGGAVKYSINGTRFFCADLLPFGKQKSFWIQVKYKEPRTYYPDTGLELWRFNKLKELQKNSGLSVLLLFTDKSEKIYGDWIDNLNKENGHGNTYNSKNNCEMIYFWLKNLKNLSEVFK